MAQRRRSAPSEPAGRARRWLATLAASAAACGPLAAATVALSLAGTGAVAGPAGAEPVTDCSTTNGVIVVVDFAHWNGPVERGCAATPTTGLHALHTAGFRTAGTTEYGTAFVCRVTDPTTGVAEPSTTPCTTTPPASAYWSYWHADPGQATWSQSSLGAESYRPPPGSVTAWVFGGTSATGGSGSGRPTFTPTQVRATNVTPVGGGGATTTVPPASGGASTGAIAAGGSGSTATPAAGSTGGGAGTSAPGSGAGSGAPAPAATTLPGGSNGSAATTSPSGAGSGSTSTSTTVAGAGGGGASSTGKDGTSAGGHGGADDRGSGTGTRARTSGSSRIVDVDPLWERRAPSAGSPLPLLVGIAAAVALAAAAGVVARRRRRAGRAG